MSSDAYSVYKYKISLGANSAAVALFAVVLLCQACIGFRTRQRWFLFTSVISSALEVAGYACRLAYRHDLRNYSVFAGQLVTLSIGPSILLSGIVHQFAKYTVVHGRQYSKLPPKGFVLVFYPINILSIVLQIVGGNLSANSNRNTSRTGFWIMMAGFAVQAAAIVLFTFIGLIIWLKVQRAPAKDYDPQFADIRRWPLFKYLIPAVVVALTFLFIRSVFRVIELAEGWNGRLNSFERYFLILDGLMVLLAFTTLTVMHPGFLLGSKPIPVFVRNRKKQSVSLARLESRESGVSHVSQGKGDEIIELA